MQHRLNIRRAALTAVAVGSLISLAACGDDPKPADGASDNSTDAGSGDGDKKPIVFSSLGLQIPAMKQLSEAVKAYAESKGYEVVIQDPKLDPQKQLADIQAVVESGSAAAVWTIPIAPESLKPIVAIAQDKGVPMVISAAPEALGVNDAPVVGLSFSTIDYVAQGTAAGEELANCINERYDGKADVLFAESAPGTAGKQETEDAVKAALAAGAPDTKIVSTITVSDRTAAQTDVGAALQGNPDVTAVFGQNDEGALGAIGAFKAAGKDLPCITENGGNDEALAAVDSGDIYAIVAVQFADDMTQNVDALLTMLDDPTATGLDLVVPQKIVKAEG